MNDGDKIDDNDNINSSSITSNRKYGNNGDYDYSFSEVDQENPNSSVNR